MRDIKHHGPIKEDLKFNTLNDAVNYIRDAGFPHVAERISLLWISPELDKYFKDIMISDRLDRQGFPPNVMKAIFFTAELHGRLFVPTDAPSPWDVNRFNK